MSEEDAARRRVISVAASWLRTPFHDCAAIKGVGVDCANLLARTYEEAGIVAHVEIAPYSPQWFMHHSQELFLDYVHKAGGQEIDEAAARMGDCVLYQIGRCYAHGGIVIKWPEEIIHAHKMSGAVVTSGGNDGDLNGRPRRFFTMWHERSAAC